MIDNHIMQGIVFRIGRDGIPFLIGLVVAQPAADEPENHIRCLDAERIILQTDTVAGCRLSGNGDGIVSDNKRLDELNVSCHIEHDGARTLPLDGPTQRPPMFCVLERSYVIHLSATSAAGISAKALSTREGCRLQLALRLCIRYA